MDLTFIPTGDVVDTGSHSKSHPVHAAASYNPSSNALFPQPQNQQTPRQNQQSRSPARGVAADFMIAAADPQHNNRGNNQNNKSSPKRQHYQPQQNQHHQQEAATVEGGVSQSAAAMLQANYKMLGLDAPRLTRRC